VRRKSLAGFRDQRGKRISHLGTDLECARADRRAKPGENLVGRYIHLLHRRFQHPASQSAPARMGGSNHRSGTITEQDRQKSAVSTALALPGLRATLPSASGTPIA
jgi:hypothetical protein